MGVEADAVNQQRREAMLCGAAWAKACVQEGEGFIPPNARLGSLSDWEWWKLGENFVSGWIAESVNQVTRDRVEAQDLAKLMDISPSPEEVGTITAILPALGDFVQQRGLAEHPLGTWPKDQVVAFAAACISGFREACIRRDERPSEVLVATKESTPIEDVPWEEPKVAAAEGGRKIRF